jgi:hypothetical protein
MDTLSQHKISEEITSRVKLGSKLLAQSCSISRRQALDAFSIGVRFEDWLELHKFLIKASGQSEPSLDWASRLKNALVLVAAKSTNRPLRLNQVLELETIGARISGALDIPKVVVLDSVLAKLCGVAAWSQVSQRIVSDESEPLYSTNEDRLQSSAYCAHLSDSLYEKLFVQEHTRGYQVRWLRRTFAANPSFLGAADHLSFMLREDYLFHEALEVIETSLETIIPVVDSNDYTLSWWCIENRSLLRLLRRRSEIMLKLGDARGALQAAEQTLTLDPGDGVWVRTVVTKILQALGKKKIAKAWEREIRSGIVLGATIKGYWLTELVDLEGAAADTIPADRPPNVW